MTSADSAAFWSYSHADNDADRDRVLELANDVAAEIRLLSGSPFELFVDRESLKWGDAWRRRLDTALVDTTFFIPIITPNYFKREECVRELLEFHGHAKSLGIEAFILPIRYIVVRDLEEGHAEPAKALIASLQWVDWQSLRLMEQTSSAYRSGVNALAQRILDLADIIAATRDEQLRQDLADDPDESRGLSELMQRVEELLPDFKNAIESDELNYWRHDATDRVLSERMKRLRASNAPSGQILATRLRLAEESLPLAQSRFTYAQRYAQGAVNLDPIVLELTRLAKEHHEAGAVLADVLGVASYAREVSRVAQQRLKEGGGIESSEYFGKRAFLGGAFRKVAQLHRDANRLTAEANDIVFRWLEEERGPEAINADEVPAG